jgi:hypothetical protein
VSRRTRAAARTGEVLHGFRLAPHHGDRLHLIIILLAAAFAPAGLTLRAPDQAGQVQPGGFAGAAGEHPPERSVVGTLDSVDPKTMQIVVRSESGKQMLHLQTSVTIRQGSKTVKTSELPAHKGERVKVRYRESGGMPQAEWIVLAAAPVRRPGQSEKP